MRCSVNNCFLLFSFFLVVSDATPSPALASSSVKSDFFRPGRISIALIQQQQQQQQQRQRQKQQKQGNSSSSRAKHHVAKMGTKPLIEIPRGGGGGGGSGFVSATTSDTTSNFEFDPLIDEAYDWLCNLGSPSALIAGAVVATLYENIHSGDLEINTELDSKIIQFNKKCTRLLLLSAFALEIISIFVTTVTGTVLLSTRISPNKDIVKTPIEYLRTYYEFEYLTARVTFLQGLINWLAAIAINHILPNNNNNNNHTKSINYINKFIASSLCTVIIWMISFLNNHLTFYNNYCNLIYRWIIVSYKQFFGVSVKKAPRPLSIILFPSLIYSIYLGIQSLRYIPNNTQNKSNSNKLFNNNKKRKDTITHPSPVVADNTNTQ